MTEKQSINETLNVIRKALEEDDQLININDNQENVLILNKLVRQDGTINVINDSFLTKKETYDLLNKKLDEVFATHIKKWLDKNLPTYIEKYFKDKNL